MTCGPVTVRTEAIERNGTTSPLLLRIFIFQRVFDIPPIGSLALQIDLPGTAEEVEVIHVVAAECRLQALNTSLIVRPSACALARSISR